MLVSHRWLQELLPDLAATPSEVAQALTRGGLEVEGLRPFGVGPEPIVVEVRQIEPHPERAKLRLVTVDVGGKTQRIVCGAPNVPAPGGLVVLAPLGTHLPAVNMTMEPREIGGILSEGMLCSERELGLAESAEGILILPAGTATPGTPLCVAIPATQDSILELGITPNRPDALGHVGVARELAALLGLPFRRPALPEARRSAGSVLDRVRIDLRDEERCPRYGAAWVEGITVAPSPLAARYRLLALGLRPISNVVDITNLALLLYGHPMHAFDATQLGGAALVIRRAADGEPIETLDGTKHELTSDDLVIADATRPVAVAGIMGGANSQVSDGTTQVVLECAYFQPSGVRRSARRHSFHTDSSYRFERGVDSAQVAEVLAYAAGLLCQWAGATLLEDAVVLGTIPLRTMTIRLRHERLENLLGATVPFEEALDVLRRLGFEVLQGNAKEALVNSASWRPDVTLEADCIEEVARVRGLDLIPTRLPAIPAQTPRSAGRLERRTAELAAQLGLAEALTYSFVDPAALQALRAPSSVVALRNPLSEDRTVLRTTLLPGLLDALRRARNRGEGNARLFAVGARFLADATVTSEAAQAARPRRPEDAALPHECPTFAAVLAGTRPGRFSQEPVDFYDAKGVVEELVEQLSGQRVEVEQCSEAEAPHLHPRARARLLLQGTTVGYVGQLHPDVADQLDLGDAAFVMEVDLAQVEAIPQPRRRFRPIPKLPATTRDLSLEVPLSLPAAQLLSALMEAGAPLVESARLLDLYEGKGIADGHRSLTYRLVYRDPKAATSPEEARTLTDKEVDTQQAKVVAAAAALGAKLRG